MTDLIIGLWGDMNNPNELLQYALIYSGLTAFVLGIIKRVMD